MVYLYTQTPELFSQISEEIRLFVDIRRIEKSDTDQTDKDGFFVLHYFSENNDDITSRVRLVDNGVDAGEYEYKTVLYGDELERKRIMKRAVKISAYRALTKYFKQQMPWGSLTGIRPTKLYRDSTIRYGEKKAEKLFLDEFDVSKAKFEFAKKIVGVQSEFLPNSAGDIDIYIGIPFCVTRCAYCSFASNVPNVFVGAEKQYVDALLNELNSAKQIIGGRNVRAVYVGGGTPTAISDMSLERVLDAAAQFGAQEFTVEAGRPDTITETNLEIIKQSGAERISVNAQTMHDDTLKRIGRRHTAGEFIKAYELAREAGFESINVDAIAGLPGETRQDISDTLRRIIELDPENITVHTLAVKRASKFAEQNMDAFPTSEETHAAVSKAAEMLIGAEYSPYYMYRQKYMKGSLENVGYSKSGAECLYNIDNMEDVCSVAAFGAGAISKRIFAGGEGNVRIERAANVKDLREYIARFGEMTERKLKLFE